MNDCSNAREALNIGHATLVGAVFNNAMVWVVLAWWFWRSGSESRSWSTRRFARSLILATDDLTARYDAALLLPTPTSAPPVALLPPDLSLHHLILYPKPSPD